MKILYICTHNRCRSILSEALSNHLGQGLIDAKSAGSQPVGEVHPLSLKYLKQIGIPTDGLVSQSWHDFTDFNPDVVITVCDAAAAEACPVYFGNHLKVHWGLSDPSKVQGDEAQIERAFLACIEQIKQRVTQLTEIAQQGLDKAGLKAALAKLGAQ